MRVLRFLARLLRGPWSLQFGTYFNTDRLTLLTIQGRVEDAATSAGLADVDVVFLDTGLDRKRSRNPDRHALAVGRSDASGSISLEFGYLWSVLIKNPGASPARGTFRLRLSKSGYRDASSDFAVEQLPRRGDRLLADLGTVRLERV